MFGRLCSAVATVSQSTPLLSTKLYIPPTRPNVVVRSRLLEKLDLGVREGRPLTLISAPAGSGKTTLLSSWLSRVQPHKVAWLSLDELDNDPARFWLYVIAALQTIQPGLGQSARDILQSPHSFPVQLILPDLLNDIAALPTPVILVLDDYHVITTAAIHDSIGYALAHLPPTLHVVLASRVDPPLPMARLRANNKLVDVRAADLRFTPDEAARFLNQCMQLGLAADSINTLLARTEGWVVGLQLAALAIQSPTGQADPRATIESFGGGNRYVLEYLAEQVLSRQPEHVQQFLMQTSILDRLCGSLCDALLDTPHSSQVMLEQLEHANLFLIPLDDQHTWYRYHHLFADLLRARLRQAHPGHMTALHARAAAWYAQNGWPDEAINHALAAEDWEHAIRLLQQNIQRLMNLGVLTNVLHWARLLPDAVVRQHPMLCWELAWVHTLADQMREAAPLLSYIETTLANGELLRQAGPAQTQRVRFGAVTMRAYMAVLTGDAAQALRIVASVDGEPLPESAREASMFYWVRGFARRMQGDLALALQDFSAAIRIGSAVGDLWTPLVPMTDMGIVSRLTGKLRQSAEIYREAIRFAGEHGAANHGFLSRAEAGLSAVLLEQNNLPEALRYARSSVTKTQHWQSANHVAWAHIFLARVLITTGDLAGADESLQQADEARRKLPVLPIINSLLAATWVRLWLAQGDLPAAERWADQYQVNLASYASAGDEIAESNEQAHLALCRVFVARGWAHGDRAALSSGLALLARAQAATQDAGRLNTLIEALVLEAVARYHLSALAEDAQPDVRALNALARALQFGEPEGYMRVFVDEGEPMQHLLTTLGRQPGRALPLRQRSYLAKLLQAFPVSPSASEHTAANLIEPLSERELEILRLIAAGMRTQAIANQLIVAQGTVKAHVAAIYRKLDVHSRTQALATARALGLLP
jgi:LuxR family maltose regulon positive regulatory protein